MIRKFTIGLLFCSVGLYLSSCKDEEAASPPKASFTATEVGDLQWKFEVEQVNANSISILPYGKENPSYGGVFIPKSSFVNGKATVTFTYDKVGTYNAVVVSNNHTGDGTDANSYSDPIVVNVGSNKAEMSNFSFETSTKTDTLATKKDISITVPYGTDLAKLKLKFSSSPFSKVTVGGVEQKSGETVVDFSNATTTPVVYTITSNKGTASATYNVGIKVTPIETLNTIKSIKAVSDEKAKNSKREFGVDINNTDRRIVVYDTLGTPTSDFDSVRIGYALEGKFAVMKYGGKLLKQDSLLNLTSVKEFEVKGQDSVAATYKIYSAVAPLMELSFEDLNPVVSGTTENFTVSATVLNGTVVTSLVPTLSFDPAGDVDALAIRAYEDGVVGGVAFINGVTALSFKKPVRFELTVHHPDGFDYKVNYTVTVTVVP